MFFDRENELLQALHRQVSAHYLADEEACMASMLAELIVSEEQQQRTLLCATDLVQSVRKAQRKHAGVAAFMHEYGLSSREGIVLMCLAEALLRIPDAATADKLIRDKLSSANWQSHLGQSHSLFVNASTWGLVLTGNIVKGGFDGDALFSRMVARMGEPLVRKSIKQSMRMLGHQFVMGATIEEALKRSRDGEHALYRYSFDMLGEAALTEEDAKRYAHAYQQAITALAAHAKGETMARPSISIKLSALHPRYEFFQQQRVLDELVPRLFELVSLARDKGVAVTLDAEEADRLEISLAVYRQVSAQIGDWDGFGLVVQAYQKRAPQVLHWLAELARSQGRRIPLRLVKGAYWDTEIKRAQERGLRDYPVFTRKENTDVSYHYCARILLDNLDVFYPQFATHNAQTVATIMESAPSPDCFEFQRLHGMGDALYEQVLARPGYVCRVYAPVGSYQDLLPYLVRRLLENGANTSFVNRVEDAEVPVEQIVSDPLETVRSFERKRHPRLPLPRDIYRDEQRDNSRGVALHHRGELQRLAEEMGDFPGKGYHPDSGLKGERVESRNPANGEVIGSLREVEAGQIPALMDRLQQGFGGWSHRPAGERAAILRRAAELYEEHSAKLMALIVAEGGRSLSDAQSEVREAIDFARYYAAQADRLFAKPQPLPGPTGEENHLRYHGRGVFVCISPWNFPVAIFSGQVMAALVAGNSVLAKPARQTPLCAAYCVDLLHRAGVPKEVLQLVPGPGRVLGEAVFGHAALAGVAFTGSTDTARYINQTLAARPGAIVPFIAETGGLNTMLVDSSALPEQVVSDALVSAFNSAGQRCSALRVLMLQREIAPKVISLLKGALREWRIGNPRFLSTDVGPVIDAAAVETLQQHVARMSGEAELIAQLSLPDELAAGSYFAPHIFRIQKLSQLPQEVFGPILHVLEYEADELPQLVQQINDSGYGLTLGIHSRVDENIAYIQDYARVGNVYVNRNMIGAVVGVQPFGGEGLSGTGPKAGGPNYLLRFASEQTLTNNTAAVGGNAKLLGGMD